jgi:hypothetical protein
MENLTEDAKARFEQNMELLERERRVFANKMENLGSASADAWQEMKEGIEAAWKDLEEAYAKAAAELKKEVTATAST